MKYKPLSANEKRQKNKEYERKVADMFIKGMKENTLPWQKPWVPNPSNMDRNLFTMQKDDAPTSYYKGVNGLLCELTRTIDLKSDDPRWATMAQIIEHNKNLKDIKKKIYIRKGVHGVPIKFYTRMYFDATDKLIKTPNYEKPSQFSTYRDVLRTYTVFHVSQMYKLDYDEEGNAKKDENGNNIELPAFEPIKKENIKKFDPIIKPETLIKNLGVNIEYRETGTCAYYPSNDVIIMAPPENFSTAQGYYDTLLHEVTHWTGAKPRLNRPSLENYSKSDKWRAKEEIIAEIGGYMLAKECNVAFNPSDNNYSYVNSWIKELQNKPEEIFKATKEAEAAKNYIINTAKENKLANEAKKKLVENQVKKEAVSKTR